MGNLRVAAGAAAFAAVVSLLAGLIGGNPFGIVLVRLLVSAVFAGGLAVAALQLLQRFLPELQAGGRMPGVGWKASPAGSDETGMSKGRPAGRPEVDILLPEENPHGEPGGSPADGLEAGRADDAGARAAPSKPAGSLEPEGPFEPARSFFGPLSAGGDNGEAEVLEEVEESDVLPDIDRLDGGGRLDSLPAGRSGSPSSRKPGRDLGEQDPESLARAVRTFLKKDQER